MWELALIARDFDVRRKAIFEDIDRKDGPMWSQIYVTCMSTIKAIEERIDNYGKPPAPPVAPAEAAPEQPPTRIVQPPKTDDVWASAPTRKGLRSSVGNLVSNVVTSPGKTPAQDWLPTAKKVAMHTTEHFLTQEQKEAFKPESVNSLALNLSSKVLTMPTIGPAFQQLFGRRLTTIVFGQPYGEISLYANAAYALSKLAVASLAEDQYGNVQRDVPAIVRTLTVVIKKLEKFRENLPMHWTDLQKNRECPEVDELLDSLKDGLNDLVAAFGQYAADLRLTRADMRLAKEAAAKKEKQPEALVEQPRPARARNGGAVEGEAQTQALVQTPEQPEMQQLR